MNPSSDLTAGPISATIPKEEKVEVIEAEVDIAGALQYLDLRARCPMTIFVHSGAKTGAISLVSTLRLFMTHMCDVVHIDEDQCQVLRSVYNTSPNAVVQHLTTMGRRVVVIDIYRNPVERRISMFFGDIGVRHFNRPDAAVSRIPLNEVFARFNKVFPHLIVDDPWRDQFDLPEVRTPFDLTQKCAICACRGATYVKLRLADAAIWGDILAPVLGQRVQTVYDVRSTNMSLKRMYTWFLADYRLPKVYLEAVMNDTSFRQYHSAEETAEYAEHWGKQLMKEGEEGSNLSCISYVSYTDAEYQLYETIVRENAYLDGCPKEYLDGGCPCTKCVDTRALLVSRLNNGHVPRLSDRVWHSDVTTSERRRMWGSSDTPVPTAEDRRRVWDRDVAPEKSVIFPFSR